MNIKDIKGKVKVVKFVGWFSIQDEKRELFAVNHGNIKLAKFIAEAINEKIEREENDG